MKQPLRLGHFETAIGRKTARLIEELEADALSEIRAPGNAFAARELLQIALLATTAVRNVHEQDASAYFHLSPVVEHWPVLYNSTTDLTEYKLLRIGHQLLQSKNPKKRGAGAGLYAFLGKEIVSRLDVLRVAALLPGNGSERATLLGRLAATHQRRNLGAADEALPKKTLTGWQQKIWSYMPNWSGSLENLPDFTSKTASEWKTLGQKLFKEALPFPEKTPELRSTILNKGDREHDSVIRTRIVYRVGKAIVSAAAGLEQDL
jgi:hypothetical protein